MSDLYGHQREVRARSRSASRPQAEPDLTRETDDHVEDLAAAYALGALDPAEREEVEFHIRFCPRCAAAVDRDLRTSGMLPFVVAGSAAPAPDVKAALFSRIGHATRAQQAASLQAAAPAPEFATRDMTIPASRPQPAAVAPATAVPAPVADPKRGRGWMGSLLSVPLLVALIATGFWGMNLRDQLAAQGTRIDSLQAQVANFGSGSTTLQLSPGRALPQAEGQLVLGADERSGMLAVDLNSDAVAGDYEVWALNADGELQPIAQFAVDASGKGGASVSLEQPFSSYTAVEIKPVGAKAGGKSVVLTSDYPDLGATGSELDALP